MASSIEKFLVKTVGQGQQKAAKKLTAKLRRAAYDSGWPSHAGRHLKVLPEVGGYSVTYPKQHADHIEALEYGTQDTPPSPLVRNFLSSIDSTHLNDYAHSAIKKAGWI